MKVTREFKIGLTAVVAMVLLYWGLNFLKGQNIFDDRRNFYAIYSRVDGLTAARPVLINGYQVGQVSQVYLHPDGSGRLIVKMQMNREFSFARNTIASIQSTDLLGEKSIDLVLGNSPEPALDGDTLQSDIKLTLTEEVNQQVAPLKNKAEKLFASMDTVLTLISGFLNDETQDNFMETFNSVRRSFARLEHTVGQLDNTVTESQDDIRTTFRNVAEISQKLNRNSDKLDNIFQNFDQVSDSLAQVRFAETFASLNRAMKSTEEVLDKVNRGEGSLGKLVNDEQLYQNLEQASHQLDELLLDIKYNPKRYVNFSLFGGNKGYSKEEIREQEGRETEKAQ